MTDVCLKRKIRNYVETVKENDPRFGIYIKDGVPLNASDKAALESVGHKETDLKALKKSDPDIDKKLMQYMCCLLYTSCRLSAARLVNEFAHNT